MIARIWAHLTKGLRNRVFVDGYKGGYNRGYEDGYRTRDLRAANICLASQGSTERERDYARRRAT